MQDRLDLSDKVVLMSYKGRIKNIILLADNDLYDRGKAAKKIRDIRKRVKLAESKIGLPRIIKTGR